LHQDILVWETAEQTMSGEAEPEAGLAAVREISVTDPSMVYEIRSSLNHG
jgi:hypothetical protein